MKNTKLTNKQLSAAGIDRVDNGEIEHRADKAKTSRKNDNVKPEP